MKMGLVFFISLLSFAVGTFVGKKFSDNQHKVASYEHSSSSEQASSESKDAERGVASVNEEKKDTLTDDEIAKLAEEFVAEDSGKGEKEKEDSSEGRHTASTHDKAAEKADSHEKDKHAEKAESHDKEPVKAAKEDSHKEDSKKEHAAKEDKHGEKAEEKIAEKKDEKKEEKQDEKKVAKTPAKKADMTSAADGKYTVQIASYPSEPEAQKMTSGLKDKGFSAFYVTAKVKEKTWYRVSVGLFPNSDEADEYRKKLDKEGISKTIVQKITN